MMMTREILKDIYKVYKETNKKLRDIKEIEISDDSMVNVDVEKTIKAMFYQEIDEMFRRLKNGKNRK